MHCCISLLGSLTASFHEFSPTFSKDPRWSGVVPDRQADGSYHCPDVDGAFGHCCLPGDCPSDATAAECEDVAGGFSVAYVTSGLGRVGESIWSMDVDGTGAYLTVA